MVNAGKILADICLEAKQRAMVALDHPHPVLHPVSASVGAFTFATGIAIKDETRVNNRLQHIHDGSMYYPITKARRRDQPLLGLKNIEILIATGLITAVQQVVMGVVQLLLKLLKIAQRSRGRPLTT